MTYRYLIGFVNPRSNDLGFGRVDVTRPAPITCDRDVNDVERNLRNHFAEPRLMVVSFSCYADPAPDKGGDRR